MISNIGRKVIFVNPPESLKDHFLEHIFKNEFEIYILNEPDKIFKVVELFPNAIFFFNIDDETKDSQEWIKTIRKLKEFAGSNITIGVFSKLENQLVKKTLLMDIGIKGGYIVLDSNVWRAVQIVNKVLEVNEAKGRRQSVRLNFQDPHIEDNLEAKIFIDKGYLLKGVIKSFSALGLLVELDGQSSRTISRDSIEKIIFSINGEQHHVHGSLLKAISDGRFFIWFKDVFPAERDKVQEYIFNSLQKSFKKLLKNL